MKVQYLDSEEEWNRAHVVVLNAQDLALSLAKSRIEALWSHFRGEKAKQEQMKATDARQRTSAHVSAGKDKSNYGTSTFKTQEDRNRSPSKGLRSIAGKSETESSDDTPILRTRYMSN